MPVARTAVSASNGSSPPRTTTVDRRRRSADVPAGALRSGEASGAARSALAHLQRLASPNLYDALRASHEVQRALARQLVRVPASQPAKRLAVFRSLKLELAAHAAAEERFLYVPMLMNDAGLDASRHALHEHHEIDELVERIESLAPGGDAWHEQAKALAHLVRHHLKEEEQKFFQTSGKILSESQKQRSGLGYLRDHDRMLRVLAKA